MNSKEQFEAWAEANHYDLHQYCQVYSNAHTQAAWTCWQSSRVRALNDAAARCQQILQHNIDAHCIDELTEYQQGFEGAADLCDEAIRGMAQEVTI